jgi:hypothetical protein
MAKKQEPAPTYGPAMRDYTLSSGRPVRLVQPDMLDLASGKVDLPNAAKSDVWNLLLRYRADADPAQQLLADEKWIRSHYYLAFLALDPPLKLDDDDDAKGVIDRRELSLPDLLAIYDFCRFGRAPDAPDWEPGADRQTLPAVGDGQGAE